MRKRKFIAIALALITALSCMSVTAFAEGATPVQSSSNTVAWTAGDYVVDSETVTLSAGVTVSGTVNLTINDGCTLTITGTDGAGGEEGYAAGTGILIYNDAILNINGTGTLVVTGGKGVSDFVGGEGIRVGSSSKLTVFNAAVNANGGEGSGPSGGDGISIYDNATVEFRNATINAAGGIEENNYNAGNGICINDYASLTVYNSTVNATGGTNEIHANYGMKVNGTVTVESGTVTATSGNADESWGIYIDSESSANLVVKGGVLTSTGKTGIDGPLEVTGGEVHAIGNSGYGYVLSTANKLNVSGGKLSLNGTSGAISIAQNNQITGGLFNVDVSSYVASGYYCVSNTDSTTNNTYPYRVTPDVCFLDLEASDNTYQDTKTIDQTYTLTQTGDATYTDVTKVKLEWTVSNIAATYESAKIWDPDSMTWIEEKENISATNNGASFTLTNYSSIAVKATASFVVENSLADTFTEATFSNNGCTVKTPVTKDNNTYTNTDFTALAQTITAALTLNASKFADKAATESTTKYGTYTITIAEAPKPLTMALASYVPDDGMQISENTLVFNGDTWDEVIENNQNNSISITISSDVIVFKLATHEVNNVTRVILICPDNQDWGLALFTTTNTTSADDLLKISDSVVDTLYIGFID